MSGSYDDRDGVIWMDGKLMNWRDAKVHVLTHGLHCGLGLLPRKGSSGLVVLPVLKCQFAAGLPKDSCCGNAPFGQLFSSLVEVCDAGVLKGL